ncbi:dienelactone hydrolase [Sphingomonas sp. Leaf407]|uniref:dienelactone hydrolase family protein n=1 Tax=unclassified Sphingomonas TaxID=196159 RepID=UPI0006FBA81D|nr:MULTISPECIES: dienelactone hydrolase family protein [unclassified Sphingomonas]KQN35595.1 dienelactone hydrolase [Sphingomonas sp. Leaf42]KQT26462.1 dienelactone hydrolase [Sphingomonas sp. Leaf407]
MILLTDPPVDLPVHEGAVMRTHVFRPAAEGRFPGVVLYSEIYQVTAPIRRLAAFLAGHGYVVAVPEVYHDYEAPGTVLAYDPAGTDRGNDLKFAKPVAAFDADATRVIDWLERHPACTGAIGAAGVCLGGHLAYRAALDARVRATACFYPTDIHSGTLGEGRSDDSLARIGEIAGELLFVWGRQDPHVPFTGRQAIREAMEVAGTAYEWHEVNAQHAFLRDEGPRYDPALFVQATAWMLALFQRALRD